MLVGARESRVRIGSQEKSAPRAFAEPCKTCLLETCPAQRSAFLFMLTAGCRSDLFRYEFELGNPISALSLADVWIRARVQKCAIDASPR